MVLLSSLLLLHSLLLCISGANYGYRDASETVTLSGNRIRGARNRTDVDIVLGGLFPVHSVDDGGARCGSIRLERGLERMEAMLYALDIINSNASLLHGLKLGYDIRDTCSSENIGLDESIDLVVSGQQLDLESCPTSDDTEYESANDSSEAALPTSTVIGAASSGVSVPVATLLRLFRIPQISYASSSARLDNRDRYGYFYRTISPDSLQAEAMIDLCMEFNWTYVSTVYTNDFYGEPGIDQFRKRAGETGICIDVDEGINSDSDDDDFSRIASLLLASSTNVVVLFANQGNARSLFSSIEAINTANGTNKRFLWIASDAWARSISIVSLFNESLAGLFGFAPYTDESQGFQDYYSQLTLESNQRNPFFPEFYQSYFNCTINKTCNNTKPVTSHPRYQQGTFIPLVIDAVYSIAFAIRDYLNDNCKQPIQWNRRTLSCDGNSDRLNGSVLLRYLNNVSFISPTGRHITFNPETGNAAGGQYQIVNYQRFLNKSYGFVPVGIWNGDNPNKRLSINHSISQFGLELINGQEVLLSRPRQSQCTVCTAGQYIVEVEGSCCGTCSNCTGQEYSNTSSSSSCSTCPDRYWGNNPIIGSTSCVALEESYLRYRDAWSIVLMIMAIIGLISVVFVSVALGLYWNTPIVKSSGREQMILLLVGIALTFLTTFFFVSKPSTFVCFFQRSSLWFCISFILASLLVKLIRISRIFLRQGSAASRPKFTEPRYQILFTLLIVSIQFIVVLISMIVVYPLASEEQVESNMAGGPPIIQVTCDSPHLAPLIILALYHTALIIFCNILAVVTIRFPENFNESKYVAFSTFSIGLIWLAFTQTYIATSNEDRTAVVSFALNLSCFAVLLCMFGPRIVIMIFFPERNVTQFTTQPKSRGSTDINAQFDTGYITTLDPSLSVPTPKGSPRPTRVTLNLSDTQQKSGNGSFDDNSTKL
ncbi:PREDICTED: metabotropic glutamate receptor 2-like [Amphimedon queenslandica]|nr:PREDICTED: metabotropic glutamate receptor 2-like [Amphimedon queenslandica]|eukprot:XP_011403383.1 PREDICTED: metabotropic glutamate receptor 2-like [Amphimedon queenslandica]